MDPLFLSRKGNRRAATKVQPSPGQEDEGGGEEVEGEAVGRGGSGGRGLSEGGGCR